MNRRTRDNERDERTIEWLCERTGAPAADVRALFAQESVRLAESATVRSYLGTLTAANVVARLLRKGKPLPGGGAPIDNR